jgi:serine/threonine protein kinase
MKKLILPKNGSHSETSIQTKRILGKGSFGVVYEINFNGRPSALKIVDKKKSGLDMDELKNEIEIIQKIINKYPKCKSKHLLCYDDISEDEKCIYFISELLDGDVKDFMNSKYFTKLDICKKIDIFWNILIQTIDGLEGLHHAGILHRDIKLENILFQRKKDKIIVKLSDFGLSCIRNKCKKIVGTNSYLSPRILFKRKIEWSTRDDLYSLGAAMYSLLTGDLFISEEEVDRYEEKDINLREAISIYKKNHMEKTLMIETLRENISDCSLSTRKKLDKMIEFIRETTYPEYKKILNINSIRKLLY